MGANPLNINGEWVPIASGETVSVGGGSIYRNGSTYVVVNSAGDGVWARLNSSFINVRAFVHDDRESDVAGLLGNNDGSSANDIALADGTVLTGPVAASKSYGVYADSWRVTDQTTLFVYDDGKSTATFTDRSFPARVVSLADLDPAVRSAAEQSAREAGLTEGTVAFDNAVLDIALTGDNTFGQGASDAPADNTEEPAVLEVQRAPVLGADAASTDTTGSDRASRPQ